MAEVAYLFGAGASAGTIPVVSKMAETLNNEDFEVISSRVKDIRETEVDFDSLGIAKSAAIEGIVRDIRLLRFAVSEHYSVDTYAKKLHLTRKYDELNHLKAILAFYISYRQIFYGLDKRYDNFWASLLDSDSRLPEKVKILSWNYDYQLEQSYLNMTNCGSLMGAKHSLRMITPDISDFDLRSTSKGFTFLKLNGAAIFTKGDEQKYICTKVTSHKDKNFHDLIQNYLEYRSSAHGFKNQLRFAWETGFGHLLANHLQLSLNNVKVLVVVGYTFPFFNRTIDKELLGFMPNLAKIYIQDPFGGEEVMNRMIELNPGMKHPIIKVKAEQFFYPEELEV